MIPPPFGAGGGAKYCEEHLLRLQLIPEFQRSHLKLSGIREALDAMTIQEMRKLATEATPRNIVHSKEALEQWLAGNFINEKHFESLEKTRTKEDYKSGRFSFSDLARGKKLSASKEREPLSLDDQQPITLKPTSWEKIVIIDGFEVHIRSDAVARYKDLVSEFISHIIRNKK